MRDEGDDLGDDIFLSLQSGVPSERAKSRTWGSHGPVSWRGCATARPSLPTGPDFKVYQKVTAGDWRLRAVATLALGFPSLVGGGKLSQTSDRLYSHGSVDRRRLFTWCGGGGRL